MSRIRLSKEFRFEMAHALWNYDGLCKNIHGHSYILRVTVIGTPINDDNHVKNGMVMDFGDLKRIVNEQIVDRLDHTVVLNEKSPYQKVLELPQMGGRHVITPYQPTCENMLVDFAQRIKSNLPQNVELHSLRLHETANSFAEWFAEDNG
ncbi:MAG: 6-carboxytetrahydropterin synthase [Breznakibacter sp.]|jgi:6-pyruvoyltetrahydropterin/6-carboxytetrahydropterin synthase|nr:6-carboxytetrahydropterin synthase [Breznakibacter sp.]